MAAGEPKGAREKNKMMSTQRMYDRWSGTYDDVENPTRDLEKHACELVLSKVSFENIIEIGGGTGKNTSWLASRGKHVTSVDLSAEMQAVAKAKVTAGNVEFVQGDIRGPWNFLSEKADLITCSLVLEHVEDLGHVFDEAYNHLNPGGHFYVCELHPFKQYTGSKARFETDEGLQVLDCYIHHVTDYTDAATAGGFWIARIDEWFDGDDRTRIPRLISFLFEREELP
jgi:ubiquinone/menaquinone biosynthesis C-methylase UbiE